MRLHRSPRLLASVLGLLAAWSACARRPDTSHLTCTSSIHCPHEYVCTGSPTALGFCVRPTSPVDTASTTDTADAVGGTADMSVITPSSGTGGVLGSGGTSSSSSSSVTGGSQGTGGTTSTGGNRDAAVPAGSGGISGTGGNRDAASPLSSGGKTGSGGVIGTGGSLGTGGRVGTGGAGTGGAGTGGAGSGGVTTNGGSTGAGGVTSPGTNPQITAGTSGFASRYWDCCKPSCAWTTNVPSCQKDGTTRLTDKNAKNGCDSGGSAFMCYDLSPWFDATTNMSYGFAALNGAACGTCFLLQFTGDGHSAANPGATALKGQQMVVQAINIGGITSGQFDLLIPGGGVGAMNGCATQWGAIDLGAQYGGLLSECKGDTTCMKGKCTSVFGSMPVLKAGCDWFTGWFNSADSPNLIYQQVPCPSQITAKSGIAEP